MFYFRSIWNRFLFSPFQTLFLKFLPFSDGCLFHCIPGTAFGVLKISMGTEEFAGWLYLKMRDIPSQKSRWPVSRSLQYTFGEPRCYLAGLTSWKYYRSVAVCCCAWTFCIIIGCFTGKERRISTSVGKFLWLAEWTKQTFSNKHILIISKGAQVFICETPNSASEPKILFTCLLHHGS